VEDGSVVDPGSSSEFDDDSPVPVSVGVSPTKAEHAETSTAIGTRESAVDRLKSGRDAN
jgi:hypothetical protein